jgi:hypothetical protein
MPKKFQPHIVVDVDNKCMHVNLEDCESVSEWIQHEGADMVLRRALDDNRVVGALLPMRNWNGKLPVHLL